MDKRKRRTLTFLASLSPFQRCVRILSHTPSERARLQRASTYNNGSGEAAFLAAGPPARWVGHTAGLPPASPPEFTRTPSFWGEGGLKQRHTARAGSRALRATSHPRHGDTTVTPPHVAPSLTELDFLTTVVDRTPPLFWHANTPAGRSTEVRGEAEFVVLRFPLRT